MTINDLEKSLNEVTKDFESNLKNEFERYDQTSATKHDLYLLAQTTHSALNSFKESIIDYLKTNR